MTRKSKPWAVVLSTPDGPIRTAYTSERKAYDAVCSEVEQIKAGNSRTTRIQVEKWDHEGGRWLWFDQINPAERNET